MLLRVEKLPYRQQQVKTMKRLQERLAKHILENISEPSGPLKYGHSLTQTNEKLMGQLARRGGVATINTVIIIL